MQFRYFIAAPRISYPCRGRPCTVGTKFTVYRSVLVPLLTFIEITVSVSGCGL
jgi:hypothetical protein